MAIPKKKILHTGIGIVCILTGLTCAAAVNLQKGRVLEVDFLDVGQGDAILIQSPYGHNILIDGGPDGSVIQELGLVLPFYDKEIDLVILTHPHADHVTGLIDVLRYFNVHEAIEPGIAFDAPVYKTWLHGLAEEQIPLAQVTGKQRIILGDDLLFTIVYPRRSLKGTTVSNVNNASVVVRLDYGNTCFLFMGDAEREVEEELVESHTDLDCDVLKVGHHGSATSSTEVFLDAVSPQYSVIEVGKNNRYKHPAKSVVDRLESRGIAVFRTDVHGTIVITSDGKKITP